MATVWRADDLTQTKPAAVKLLHGDVGDRPDLARRFLREARAIMALRGPNLVEILEAGVEGSAPFMAMELLHGETLGARLAREKSLAPRVAYSLLSQAAGPIGRAHAHSIVHRDIKPANLFITPGDDLKLLDFGIAKVLDDAPLSRATLTAPGATVGTISYMSPEQARGTYDIDHRADLWSLAIVAFQCIVGCLPFRRDSFADLVVALHTDPAPVPSTLAEGIPRGFDAWFARAVRRSPDERYQSAEELITTLGEALALR